MNEFALAYDVIRLVLFGIVLLWFVRLVYSTSNVLLEVDFLTKLTDKEKDIINNIKKQWFYSLIGILAILTIMSYLIPSMPKMSTRQVAPPAAIVDIGKLKMTPTIKRTLSDSERLERNQKLYDSNKIKE